MHASEQSNQRLCGARACHHRARTVGCNTIKDKSTWKEKKIPLRGSLRFKLTNYFETKLTKVQGS